MCCIICGVCLVAGTKSNKTSVKFEPNRQFDSSLQVPKSLGAVLVSNHYDIGNIT